MAAICNHLKLGYGGKWMLCQGDFLYNFVEQTGLLLNKIQAVDSIANEKVILLFNYIKNHFSETDPCERNTVKASK